MMRLLNRFFAALLLILMPAATMPAYATVWYVDVVNGGTRFSATNMSGQCNGQSSTPYPGSGTNQPCPYNDARLLWNDPSVLNDATWVIAGGDIVTFLNAGPTHATQMAGSDGISHCFGIGVSCTPPTVPDGTMGSPTTFRGVNYTACRTTDSTGFQIADPTKTSYIFGGGGAGAVFNINSANLQFQCLDVSDHSNCNGLTVSCSGTDWVGIGFYTGAAVPSTSRNITMTDLKIHGMQSRAIRGNIGLNWTLDTVEMFANGSAGWDLDPGGNQDSFNAVITMNHVGIDWNGCSEEFPIVDPIPIQTGSCTDQNSSGYGDGIGTPPDVGIVSWTTTNSRFTYNTQDGDDMGHGLSGTFIWKNNYFAGNMGGNVKTGTPNSMIVYNNFIDTNCNRMSAPITGVPSGYNTHLSDFCRASGDANSFNVDNNSHSAAIDWEFNTIAGYAATMIDGQCFNGPCVDATVVFKNNVILGYSNAAYNSGLVPGMWNGYTPTTQDHNLFFNLRSCPANGSDLSPTCATNANFTSQPASPISSESALDSFNFYPAIGSALIHTGLFNSSVPTDYYGVTRPNPPTVGAAEPFGGSPTAGTPTFSPTAPYTGIATTVTLSSATSGATFCSTLDGSTPTANGAGTCTHGATGSTVPISSTATLKAIASKSGLTDSGVASGLYTITTPPVTTMTISGTVTITNGTIR